MRHMTAARTRDESGWHYVNLGRDGGHPIGYCTEHEPHPTEREARECYTRWERDHIALRRDVTNWQTCRVCKGPTKSYAQIDTYMGALVSLCNEHLTVEQAAPFLYLDGPAGDSWVS